jgi:anti-anti-sigma factor
MIKVEKVNDVFVAHFENVNRFNALMADPVKEELKKYFDKEGTKLALSLRGIRFVDSTGFGVFLSLMKAASNNQGQFRICDVAPEVMELFNLLHLNNVFELDDSADSCLDKFKS